MQVIDLVRYNHVVRKSYLEVLSKLSWEEVADFRGLSWDSMRDVFVHLTLVEDRWISYIIPDRFNNWVDPDFNAFTNMDSLTKYMHQVHKNTEKYLARLSPDELNREIVIPWGEKPFIELKVEAVLTHMVIEDMVHYGELSAVLWQMGLEAPYKAFWRYKYQNP
jgi:uncharacterized damage-inducible protein DinB